jgi:UDP-N-acetylglucosamine 2-epimerase (non-hydrolysing)
MAFSEALTQNSDVQPGTMKKIHVVGGARPNFMKIAPLVRALQAHGGLAFKIIHTGQHYDWEMSDVFFQELGIPSPDFHLEAGSGSHAQQTARVMVAFEEVCLRERPDAVVVVGDVNSTLACSIVAKKLHIAVAHVEAGLRSGDLRMPEEINRIVTDAITDWCFVTEPSGVANLLREGKPRDRVFHVGNIMIDTLFHQRDRLLHMDPTTLASTVLKQRSSRYGVVTLHRPSNVDNAATLTGIAAALSRISERIPLVFPVHPRTRENLKRFGIALTGGVFLTNPLSYMEFLNLWTDAKLILTDSGGLQEESTALGVPCLTIRDNTERPVTVEEGTNVLVGTRPSRIVEEANRILSAHGRPFRRPALWDGQSAVRIVDILAALISESAERIHRNTPVQFTSGMCNFA